MRIRVREGDDACDLVMTCGPYEGEQGRVTKELPKDRAYWVRLPKRDVSIVTVAAHFAYVSEIELSEERSA